MSPLPGREGRRETEQGPPRQVPGAQRAPGQAQAALVAAALVRSSRDGQASVLEACTGAGPAALGRGGGPVSPTPLPKAGPAQGACPPGVRGLPSVQLTSCDLDGTLHTISLTLVSLSLYVGPA